MKKINSYGEVLGLLDRPRTGWLDRGISLEIAETILEHSLKVKNAARIFGKHYDIDHKKLIDMAMNHDISEYKFPDLTPRHPLYYKRAILEREVIEELSCLLENGKYIRDLRIECEIKKTKEAKIVFGLDKMDAAIQAMDYEDRGYEGMDEFYSYTFEKLKESNNIILSSILSHLLKSRNKHENIYDQYYELLSKNGV